MAIIKGLDDILKIKESAAIVAQVLEKLKELAKPGIKTLEFDKMARAECRKLKARPAFLGYRGYPAAVCVSVNDAVVHGIPSARTLKEGDIVSLDFGVEKDGFFGDSAVTLAVGKVSVTAQKLLRVTEEALTKGIEKAQPGNRLYDISAAIQEHVEASGFSVVRDFVGHAIGRELHEEPMVPNFGKKGTGPDLKAGMTLAIEPMVNEKGWQVEVQDDEWTVLTKDHGLSAHFEHTVAITEGGPVILSRLD